MISPADFYAALSAHGVTFFAGVPDSLLKDVCAYIDAEVPRDRHVITANEGSAIGLASGYQIATGKTPLVYMQNSGLGNAINPLVSLADPEVYRVPMILLIGWRGEPGVSDEPQHKKMGAVTLDVLEAIGVPYRVLSDTMEGMENDVREAYAHARDHSAPYALVVKKGTFDTYVANSESESPTYALMREDAVAHVISLIEKDAVVISTTGKLSRELFEIREKNGEGHERDFLTVGAMGHASAIALGVALAEPERTVYCFDGDGAVLMHMGSVATIGARAPKNFRHIVFNNGMHESVGGQETTGFTTNFSGVAEACGYVYTESVSDVGELSEALRSIAQVPGSAFLEIRIRGGSRDDLGRPTRTPQENKTDFEGFLRG